MENEKSILGDKGNAVPATSQVTKEVLDKASNEFIDGFQKLGKLLGGDANTLQELEQSLSGSITPAGSAVAEPSVNTPTIPPLPSAASETAAASTPFIEPTKPQIQPKPDEPRKDQSTEGPVTEISQYVDEILKQQQSSATTEGEDKVKIDYTRLMDPAYIAELQAQSPEAAFKALRITNMAHELTRERIRQQMEDAARGGIQQPRQTQAQPQIQQVYQQRPEPEPAVSQEVAIQKEILAKLESERKTIEKLLVDLNKPEPEVTATEPAKSATGELNEEKLDDSIFRVEPEKQTEKQKTFDAEQRLETKMNKEFARLNATSRLVALQNAARDAQQRIQRHESAQAMKALAEKYNLQQQNKGLEVKQRLIADSMNKVAEELNQIGHEISRRFGVGDELSAVLENATDGVITRQGIKQRLSETLQQARTPQEVAFAVDNYKREVGSAYSRVVADAVRSIRGTHGSQGAAQGTMQSRAQGTAQGTAQGANMGIAPPPTRTAEQQAASEKKMTYEDLLGPGSSQELANELDRVARQISSIVPRNVSEAFR